MPPAPRPLPPVVVAVGLAWFVVAFAAAAAGVTARLTPPAPQVLVLILTAATLVATFRVPGLRDWWTGVDLRALIGLHLVRFVGFYFLYLYGQGELPWSFAVPGGWGDITAAGLALVTLFGWSRLGASRRWLLAWNTFGLADILFVVASAARAGLADPPSMVALFRLPLSLIPTFFVPLIIASHVILFARLRPASAA
jgi:hypothetical protein